MTHKLMIKTHNITGLKYLCYTRKKDHIKYTGSGIDWLQHLIENNFDFSTELLLETQDFDLFKIYAIQISKKYDIVNSREWANRKIEEGDGGDTVSDKKWITDGTTDRYLTNGLDLPEGWKYGRSKCVFNDPKKQKEFGGLADSTKRGNSIKKAWEEGRVIRDHSKCGVKGALNPAKRQEVREKISASRIGKPLSDKTKENLSASRKGRIVSEETRRKISESNKGKTHSEESRQKMSEAAFKRKR